MHNLVFETLDALDKGGINYCLLRGYEKLSQTRLTGDFDLLVEPAHLPLLVSALAALGFEASHSWSFAPDHIFFAAYDQTHRSWLKFDVVTNLRWGNPISAFSIDITESYLLKRRRRSPVYVLSPEDEFITLLLHCLLDKTSFAEASCGRLLELRKEIASDETAEKRLQEYVERCLAPAIPWTTLTQAVQTQDWQKLTEQRMALALQLFCRDPIRSGLRIFGALIRRAGRPLSVLSVVSPRRASSVGERRPGAASRGEV